MVVAFGFGAGDFIAATKLLGQAAQALSRTSGATGQYQQAAVELQSIHAVLQQVEALESDSSNADIVRKIQFCSHVCHIPLANFVGKVKKYEQYLGPSACATNARGVPRRFLRAGWKIHWALALERDVSDLKAKIAPQIAAINALLELESLQCLRDVQKDTAAASRSTAAHLEQLRLCFDELKIQVQDRLCSQDQFATVQTLARRLPSGAQTNNVDPLVTSQGTDLSTTAIQDRLAFLEDLTEPLLYRPTLRGPLPASSAMTPSHPIAEDAIETHRKPCLGALASHESSGTIAAMALSTATSISELATRIVMAILLLLPSVQRFLRSLQAIARAPTLLLQDNIILEDALGRSLNLPYEHFRHWPVFYARLQEAFRDVPGDYKVRHNQFHILNMQAAGNLVLTRKIWGSAVFPGSKLAMSMLYQSSDFETRLCPRCNSADYGRSKAEWMQCPKCSLTYRRLNVQRWALGSRRSAQAVPEDIMDGVEFITALDESRKLRGRPGIEWQQQSSEMQFFKRIHLIGNERIGKGEYDDYERRKSHAARASRRINRRNGFQDGALRNQGANVSGVRSISPPRGILRRPTREFPEFPDEIREGVAPLQDMTSEGIPPGARWTKIDRRLVNPGALEEAGERFEERRGSVLVLRVLNKDQIRRLADRTLQIRQARPAKHYKAVDYVRGGLY